MLALENPLMGQTISAIKFFKPKAKFINWIKKTHPINLVYDVGAGCGHVTKKLIKAGINAIALDIMHRDPSDYPVTIADAAIYEYSKRSVVLLCRPCHGYFIEHTFRQALSRNCIVYYVGKSSNVEDDLYGFECKRILTNVGEDKEEVWQVLQENNQHY